MDLRGATNLENISDLLAGSHSILYMYKNCFPSY
jgi:hypothetical protein